MPYYRGDLARFQASFIASGGGLVDPTDVWFLTIDPTGARASYHYNVAGASITRTGAGGYYKDVDLQLGGNWSYRWEGTGAAQAAVEAQFRVELSFKP